MSKVTLNTIASRYGSLDALNDNFDQLESALDNVLFRDGTSPNAMEVDLDMGGNSLLNVNSASVQALSINGVNVGPAGLAENTLPGIVGQAGKFLNTTGTATQWKNVETSDVSSIINAVTRPLSAVVGEIVNVKNFGALGNNVADDTAAIAAAIAAAQAKGGGVVFFPRGTYRITSELTITNTKVLIVGEGIDSSIIRQTSATANGLNFNYPISFAQPTGGGVRDITVEAGAGFSTGTSYTINSTGTGIRVRNASDNFSASNFVVHNFSKAIQLLHCWNTRWQHFRTLFANTHVEIDQDSNNIGAGNTFFGIKISNQGMSPIPSGSIGIHNLASGGNCFAFIDITEVGRGVVTSPSSAAQQVLYDEYFTVRPDTCVADCWDFDGSAGRPIWSIRLTNCWGAFSTNGRGLRLRGSGVDGIRWVGGALRENGSHGAGVEAGPKNWTISDVEIASNGKLSAGVHHGVSIAAGLSGWMIRGCHIGNFASTLNTQQNGIDIAPGVSTNFRISENTFVSNLGNPLQNGSSSLLFDISNNLPRQVNGLNESEAVTYTGSTPSTVAANTTVYLGAAGASTTISHSVWVVSRPSLVSRIYAAVQSAPGAGESFTYTLFKNGIATSLTCTISGAAAFSATSNSPPVLVEFGDFLELRLVTSNSAAVTRHRYFVTVE